MGAIVRVDFGNPDDFDRWQTYLASRSDTHCSDSGRWRLLFQELYGIRNSTYAFITGGVVKDLVSLYHFRSPFKGSEFYSDCRRHQRM